MTTTLANQPPRINLANGGSMQSARVVTLTSGQQNASSVDSKSPIHSFELRTSSTLPVALESPANRKLFRVRRPLGFKCCPVLTTGPPGNRDGLDGAFASTFVLFEVLRLLVVIKPLKSTAIRRNLQPFLGQQCKSPLDRLGTSELTRNAQVPW